MGNTALASHGSDELRQTNSKSSQMSHFSDQFARNYFYQLRYRNIPALRVKLENRGGWWLAGGVKHLTQESLQSTRKAKSIRFGSTPLLCQGGRDYCGFSAAVETASLPSQRQGQVNLSPPHLCQWDLNPQWTFLPLCPPASPWSLLLDALLLSGSESVDLGLSGHVKDNPSRSEPWAPPITQPVGWVQESPRTRASYKYVMIQTQQSCMSGDSLNWQKELQGSPPRMPFSLTDNFAGTTLPGYVPSGLGMELWPHKVKLLMWNARGQHRGVFLRVTWSLRTFSVFLTKKIHRSLWLPPGKIYWHLFLSVAYFIKALLHMPRIIPPHPKKKVQLERIQSFPLKSVFPVSISAMMQPIDQISTIQREKGEKK